MIEEHAAFSSLHVLNKHVTNETSIMLYHYMPRLFYEHVCVLPW